LLIATRDRDLSAFRDEKAGCGQSDAAIASGNESFLACEFHDSSSMTSHRPGWSSLCDRMVIREEGFEKKRARCAGEIRLRKMDGRFGGDP
jgi:hypothetical protein